MLGFKVKQVGFTLIEILIVLVIIMLVSALVAPNLLNTYEKQKMRQEIKQLNTVLIYAAKKSIEWQGLDGNVLNNRITLKNAMLPSEAISYKFNYIEFEETQFFYNKRGFTKSTYLVVNDTQVAFPRSLSATD